MGCPLPGTGKPGRTSLRADYTPGIKGVTTDRVRPFHRSTRRVAAAQHVGAREVRLLAARLGHRCGEGHLLASRARRSGSRMLAIVPGIAADPVRGRRRGRVGRRRSRRRGCAGRPPVAHGPRTGGRPRGRPRRRAAGRRWPGRRRRSRSGGLGRRRPPAEDAVPIGQGHDGPVSRPISPYGNDRRRTTSTTCSDDEVAERDDVRLPRRWHAVRADRLDRGCLRAR